MRVTADMLPEEGGDVIRFVYAVLFPEGQTVEELKNSPHKCFRDIGKYFEEMEGDHGLDVL